MHHWLWLYSIASSKAPRSSRSRGNPIALPKPKPPKLPPKLHPDDFFPLPIKPFCGVRFLLRNHSPGPNYAAEMVQFIPAAVIQDSDDCGLSWTRVRITICSALNRSVEEWMAVFDEPMLGQSALDRFCHRAHQFVIEGESYRKRMAPGSASKIAPKAMT